MASNISRETETIEVRDWIITAFRLSDHCLNPVDQYDVTYMLGQWWVVEPRTCRVWEPIDPKPSAGQHFFTFVEVKAQ